MRYKNIAISGDIGTGKTTLAKKLAEKLQWKHTNAGDFFRAWHEENKIPLNETEKIPPEKDKEMDFGFQDLMKNEEHTIFESRLAGYLAKDLDYIFKILCIAELNVAIQRAGERDQVSEVEAKQNVSIRSQALKEKFKKLYGVDDYLDPKYFDLVIDSTTNSPDENLEIVLTKLGLD
jgi:CMP/dCMP kinase